MFAQLTSAERAAAFRAWPQNFGARGVASAQPAHIFARVGREFLICAKFGIFHAFHCFAGVAYPAPATTPDATAYPRWPWRRSKLNGELPQFCESEPFWKISVRASKRLQSSGNICGTEYFTIMSYYNRNPVGAGGMLVRQYCGTAMGVLITYKHFPFRVRHNVCVEFHSRFPL